MAAHFLTVVDTFETTSRGVVVVPGPLENEYSGPREMAVRLVLPNGEEQEALLTPEHVFQTPPPSEHRYACLLKGLTKADVPIGTEVWTTP
jgi:hypothetical protein